LEVWLKRYNGFSLLKNVRLFPRRSKSIFCTVNDLKLLRGLFVISTTDGIMTHRRAILRGVGGKIFCSFVI
jgi:ribosomal protein S8